MSDSCTVTVLNPYVSALELEDGSHLVVKDLVTVIDKLSADVVKYKGMIEEAEKLLDQSKVWTRKYADIGNIDTHTKLALRLCENIDLYLWRCREQK